MAIVRFTRALCVLACAALGACAGSGAGLDANGRPIGSEGSGGPLLPTFESIQNNVFTPICSVCHAGGAAPEGMRLDAANSYAMIVGVPSTEVPAVLRIKPGDPDNSYLIQKIEGRAAVGAQMPYGGPPLPSATIAAMRQWVTDGALKVQPAALAPRLVIAAAIPATGDVLIEAPTRIVVAFDRELDQTRLDGGSLRLERFAPAREPQSVEQIPFALTVPQGNSSALLLTPRAPLPNGLYRVVVTAPPATGISAISGARLGDGLHETLVSVFAVEAAP
jgi:hypothetical protein